MLIWLLKMFNIKVNKHIFKSFEVNRGYPRVDLKIAEYLKLMSTSFSRFKLIGAILE